MTAIKPVSFDFLPANVKGFLDYTEFSKSPTHRNRLHSIITLLRQSPNLPSGAAILEVGCGTGNISIPLGSLGYRVLGIDIHTPSIEAARQRNPFADVEFAARPLEDVDLMPYNAVILTEVLEHVREYDVMMDKLARGMKRDARLILTVPNGWGIVELCCRPSYILKGTPIGARLVKAIRRMLHAHDLTTANEQTPHVNFFTLGALAQIFSRHGLQVEAFHRYFISYPLREIFLSNRPSEANAQKDFMRSQEAAPSTCAMWSFLLKSSRDT